MVRCFPAYTRRKPAAGRGVRFDKRDMRFCIDRSVGTTRGMTSPDKFLINISIVDRGSVELEGYIEAERKAPVV